MDKGDLRFLLFFNRVTNYTLRQKYDIYKQYKNFTRIHSEKKNIEKIFGKTFLIEGKSYHDKIVQEHIEKEISYYASHGIVVIDIAHEEYPARLHYIYDPPLVLFVKGNANLLNKLFSVALVGARKASNRSLTLAYAVAKEMAAEDVCIVSGLASGVDLFSHRGAVNERGATVAVLGNGIDIMYPRRNAEMYQRIAEKGCIVTEFNFGSEPRRYNFPRRNRIISGLSLGVVVVEAGKKSGALITAQYALDQGREVMAFPGKPESEYYSGNNYLIKEGANLVENAGDIMVILGKKFETKRKSSTLSYSSLEKDILQIIGDDEVSLEDIGMRIAGPISQVAGALMFLELKGVVTQRPGKIFSRVV